MGADKSLARPGRKQATATKLRIYSAYSPRSSIHFLAPCSNFCKSLKKIHTFVRPGSPRQQWPLRRMKNGDLSIVFQSREQVVVQRGQIRRIGWVIKTLEAQVGQYLLGCKWPLSRGSVVEEQDPVWWYSRCVFPSKYSSIAPADISNTPRWYFGPLVDNEWGGCRLDPKKSRRELFQRIFALRIFGAGWDAMPPLHW